MATNDEIRETIQQHQDPFVTATDVANHVGVARQTAHKYLQRMHDEGGLEKKKIGGSAVIWWIED